MRATLLLLLVAVAACRSRPGYAVPPAPTLADAYAAIRADGEAGRVAEEDLALWRSELAAAALAAGAEQDAFRALDAAGRTMGMLESSNAEAARAILGSEATKTWKGDPYERCMNGLYKGLLYWRRGDLDNASACFKRGLLADAWSEAGEHQQDFAALMFLLGWVSDLRGKTEQAAFSFREASEVDPSNAMFAEARPAAFNVLAVIDIGRGPVKYADGHNGSVARFRRGGSEEAGVEILVDGESAGRSVLATDLLHQATTRGKRVLDGIRKGKAIFKTATGVAGVVILDEGIKDRSREKVAVGAGLILLSVLTRAEADVRHWSLLPAEVHFLPLAIPPGEHRVEVRALDAEGRPIAGFSRVFEVTVEPDGDTLYYFRAGRNRVIYGLTDSGG